MNRYTLLGTGHLLFAVWISVGFLCSPILADDVTRWQPVPAELNRIVAADSVRLQSDAWGSLVSSEDLEDVQISTTVTIDEPAATSGFFGQSWSVWPDATLGDRGFEASIQVRTDTELRRGYRVQLSHDLQSLALVRYPDGGYVRVVPCRVPRGEPIPLTLSVSGSVVAVRVHGEDQIRYHDPLLPGLPGGRCAIGVSSRAKVTFKDTRIERIDREASGVTHHEPAFAVRNWLGGRPWLFDGTEPILLLPVPEERYINNAKLRPGLKPLLSWNSHWGIENQGAFPDGASDNSPITVTGGGKTIAIQWTARQKQGRFETATTLDVGFDPDRQTYVYDTKSELRVLGDTPFHFRYGYDFEHHTPLDPFGWKYLLIRTRAGTLTYRPLAPFDPGPLDDIESYHGLRVWHGRNRADHWLSPAVEYQIEPEWIRGPDGQGGTVPRSLNTAVCAAFYDTGVAFAPETARPGDRLRVRYRYTGYRPEESAALFAQASVQPNPRIDPDHHFVFARDQWPTIGFQDRLTMDQPWWGGRPFLSGHNARPTYDTITEDGQSCLRLGPVSWGIAPIGPASVPAGRYRITARVCSRNVHGPGGRIEVLSLKKADPHGNGYVLLDQGNLAARQVRHFENGTWDWREVTLDVDHPQGATGLALGLGNAGTGDVLIAEVAVRPWEPSLPGPTLHTEPPQIKPSVPGAKWDLRMAEQQGLHVYNAGSSAHRTLELANLDWVVDAGRSAIRFAENEPGRADYPRLGILDLNVRHPVYGKNYAAVSHGAYGLGGHHGGGDRLAGLTLAAWIKPAVTQGKSQHGGKGDVIGYGARRFILGLHGQSAPYRLGARINVNDRFEAARPLEAERWSHVALTAEPTGENWQIRLYQNGEQVAEGLTKSLPAASPIPDSLILGAELFYLHDAYYRGLIGPAVVVERTLTPEEIHGLAQP